MLNLLEIMKSRLFRTVLIFCGVLTILSCDKNDANDNTGATIDVAKVKDALLAGEWRIDYYFDDTDETSDYSGYILTFKSDGVLGATNGSTSLTGSWSISDSDKSDDSTDGSLEFNIFFSSPDIFEELSDDWDFLKFSDNKIELKDISGNDGSTDFLTFEKI